MENNHRKFGDTPGNKNNMTVMKNPPLLEKKKRRRRRRMNMKLKMMIMIALIEESLKKKIAQMTPPVKLRMFKKLLLHLQLTVMETLQINKMKRDKEAGDKKKKRKQGKNTAEVTAEKSHFLQQVAEYVSKKYGRGQLIVNF